MAENHKSLGQSVLNGTHKSTEELWRRYKKLFGTKRKRQENEEREEKRRKSQKRRGNTLNGYNVRPDIHNCNMRKNSLR